MQKPPKLENYYEGEITTRQRQFSFVRDNYRVSYIEYKSSSSGGGTGELLSVKFSLGTL